MARPGDRIRLLAMPDDPDPIPAGTTGTVVHVTTGAFAQIDVDWDNGRSLALIPDVDRFDILTRADDTPSNQ